MKWLIVYVALIALLPSEAGAQGNYGRRVPSRDGAWLLPVASNMLGSSERDHIARGSVQAWDVSAAVGSPVFPIAAGKIEYVGCNNAGGYGCWLFINHGNAKAIYAHCLADSLRGSHGETVTQWSQICNVGLTGKTSWPHVHLEIHRIGGGRYDIGQFFDMAQMYYCKFCRSQNEPAAQIVGVAQRSVNTSQMSTPLRIWWFVVAFLILSLAYWVSGYSQWSQHAIYHGMAMFVCVAFWIGLGGATGQAQNRAPSGWESAYKITIGSEGWQCTKDPVRTMGGITQGAYDAWRMSQGIGAADVCESLTEQQRQSIFVDRFWRESGADGLPSGLAITHVDFAFNAGVGAAKAALAASGGNAHEYNNYREQYYLSRKSCSLYCAGWLNRLNRIRKVTE